MWYFIQVVICGSLMISDVEMISCSCWPVVYLLWKKKISLQVLCPFLNCFFIFIFCYWFVSVFKNMLQFSSVQSLSHVQLFVTPWIAACQASLSITSSWSSLKLMSIELVMPSSHLILCHPLFLLPPIPPSISLFQWVNSSHEVAKVLQFQL